ncbi:homoserine O-succinyltransferase [Pontibacillus yanchengensis]|uniref:Homoserine O-succinyltransferase n=2 Tax=Pontibacillus yanchengensis TaxID=462910 RepID=A0ACC7VBW4_9BACI|nr:homoserine O-succinyltransferase [Pontibacillus yanchengensis]MYL35401.1 homoserine O-succinyltransferase [Pontibacillus yanchengensis]MYL52433.1 homoserine O-succinyltransferase [Pontibacillus yanchengensis]
MPINIPSKLPAYDVLENENIFLMDDKRAVTQDIRPLNILILNLMPEKERTETQLLRLLSNSPLQVNVEFLHTATYESKNVSQSHLHQFYKTFDQVKDRRYDGMIITGAPVELLPFEEVDYWKELTKIMEWSKTNVTSCLHICWGAQAALYYHYGINKYTLPQKLTGVFRHYIMNSTVELLRGFDDEYLAPHSRYTDVPEEEIIAHDDLLLLSSSEEAGAFMAMSKDEKHVMITGHIEYDAYTLSEEYQRDIAKGLETAIPKDYFPKNDPEAKPLNRWRSHAYLLFSNWLNYYVYQETPYEWD